MREQVWAVSMVCDEEDMIEYTVANLVAQGVDGFVIAENLSADGTPEILQQIKKRCPVPMFIECDTEPGYYQGLKMTRLANIAAREGATYIIPFDADEIWVTDHYNRVADAIREANLPVMAIPYVNHWSTLLDVWDPDPTKRMLWREKGFAGEGSNHYHRIAFRYVPNCEIVQGNNLLISQFSEIFPAAEGRVWVHHFPYRSVEQFINKAIRGSRAYLAAPDLPTDWGHIWRHHGSIYEEKGVEGLRQLFFSKWCPADPAGAGLILPKGLSIGAQQVAMF